MLTRLNPLTVLGICLLWIIATTLVHTVAFQTFALCFFGGMLLAFRRVGPLKLLVLTVPFALFGFGFLTTHILFRLDDMSTVAVFSKDLASANALNAGLVLFLRAIAGGMISLFFALCVDSSRLVRALMAHLRLPPAIAYALFAAMQIVPDIAARANDMRMAAAMRGGRLPRRFPTPFEAAGLLIPLLAYAIRRAGRSAIAMEARGFASANPRTIVDVPSYSGMDCTFAAMALVLLALAVLQLGT